VLRTHFLFRCYGFRVFGLSRAFWFSGFMVLELYCFRALGVLGFCFYGVRALGFYVCCWFYGFSVFGLYGFRALWF
jgi:hypothetical protein